jgi:SagB-type dehydrogenase family enzyme
MTMKAFTDPRAGVSGLKPGGWAGPDVGLWVRASDGAMLLQRAIPNMTADQVRLGLIPMFDLPKLRERAGQHKTDSFEWDLYHTNAEDAPDGLTTVDAALAQTGKWAFIVLLVSKTPAARRKLYEQVFLPALNALTPVYTGAEAARVAKERARQYGEAVHSVRETMKCSLTAPTDWVSDQMKNLAMPPSQKAWNPACELIVLPPPDKSVLKKADILTCIADRRSRRKYSEANLTLAELSYLLWATQGVRKALPSGRHYRTVPSGGSRHSFETYLVIQHVEELKTGVYRYLALDHKLVHLFTAENLSKKMTALASDQPFVGNSAVCFIWSSIPYRMEWRYGLESERVILMDVGHVCQNLYLAAESIGCGTCGVAAYQQDDLDKFLGLDGRDEFVIYLAPVGKVGTEPEE